MRRPLETRDEVFARPRSCPAAHFPSASTLQQTSFPPRSDEISLHTAQTQRLHITCQCHVRRNHVETQIHCGAAFQTLNAVQEQLITAEVLFDSFITE